MSDVILAGDDGRMYRISKADLDRYEISEDDPAAEHRDAMMKAAAATKKAAHPVADACWIAQKLDV